MKKPAITFIAINIEENIDKLYDNLTKLLKVVEDSSHWKDISELNIITYFVYNSGAIVNSNSKELVTYSDLLSNLEKNNFSTNNEIIEKFLGSIYDKLIEVIEKEFSYEGTYDARHCWLGGNDPTSEEDIFIQGKMHAITEAIIFNNYNYNYNILLKYYDMPLKYRYQISPIHKDNFSYPRIIIFLIYGIIKFHLYVNIEFHLYVSIKFYLHRSIKFIVTVAIGENLSIQ